VAIIGLNWPGHLSYDSVIQLSDGRTGVYHTWHPPIMAWLLGLGDRLVPGAGLYMALQALILLIGFGGLTAGPRPLSRLAPLIPLVLACLPLILIWQGIVWKDVLFADAMLAGFALLFCASASPSRRGRLINSVLGLAFLTLAALARQNGVIALAMGAAALGYTSTSSRLSTFGRLWRAAVVAAIAFAVCFGVSIAISGVLARRAVDPGASEAQLHMLQTYDVVGAIAHQPNLELRDLSPSIAELMRQAAATRYTSRRNDALLKPPFNEITANDADEIQSQWIDIILHHPKPWLEHRAAVFGWHIGSNANVCYAETTGVDGLAPLVRKLGLTIHQSPRDLGLEIYAGLFHPTPLNSHIFYALAALGFSIVFFRSPHSQEHVLGFMLIGALMFTASFALIGVACDYRYLYALDLSTIGAGFYWLLRIDLPSLTTRRLGRSSTAPVRCPS